jgi:hypothetical protein
MSWGLRRPPALTVDDVELVLVLAELVEDCDMAEQAARGRVARWVAAQRIAEAAS